MAHVYFLGNFGLQIRILQTSCPLERGTGLGIATTEKGEDLAH